MTIREEFGVGRIETFPLPTDQDFLFGVLKDVFENHWREIVFGSLIQGAVFEIKTDRPPETIGLFDGYLTVHYGIWHFHVCIGPHKGNHKNPTPPELATHRRCARAEFYRLLNSDDTPRSWGLRLFNGGGEQQLTVFFPNPFLGENEKALKQPDWSRLSMWDDFRRRYLGLEPDPRDRSGKGVRCGGH